MANWMRRCHDCNFPLGKKDYFCPRCGAKQRREKLADQDDGDERPMREGGLQNNTTPINRD